MLRTTLGKLMVNEALPEAMRDYSRVLDKKGVGKLLAEVAKNHPDKYVQISHQLNTIGQQSAYTTGGNSFGLDALRKSTIAEKLQKELLTKLSPILSDDSLSDEQRSKAVVELVGELQTIQTDAVYDESERENNPLARQLKGAGRGNKLNLISLRGGDLLYTDHHNRVIPLPVLHSYSQGLKPAEYWAAAYGARRGVVDTKMATAEAGFLSKILSRAGHRGVVSAVDADEEPATLRGLVTSVDDADNEGSLLAQDAGPYKRNTTLTSKMLNDLRKRGIKQLLVRSVLAGGAPDGSFYARDVGMREYGRLPAIGELPGLTAAQALGEPLAQSSLSSKHSGGVAGSSAHRAMGGFAAIEQLINIPKSFPGGATHAQINGRVEQIAPAPAGGQTITIAGEQHYVPRDVGLLVQRGQAVEAGDALSEGLPNPSQIVQHKGIGEGRRYLVDVLRGVYRDAGLPIHRRNLELMSHGLINHVRLLEETADGVPGDIIPYSMLEHRYQPRPDSYVAVPKNVVGKYLERPYLHYSIGTRVQPSMLPKLTEFGLDKTGIEVHDDPPPFESEMVRGSGNLLYDPDWMTRMLGSNLKQGLLHATQRGAISDPEGTSFVPSLARAVDFGHQGVLQSPKVPAH